MISYITGKIIDLDFTNVVILTSSGIWYELWINELTYSKIALEEDVSMYVYHQISESNEALFWFLEKEEKKIFTELLKISWVWGKWAMQILSIWTERLILAIKSEDNKTIEGAKWIWKKMAEKIILELKDKDFWINISSRENIIKANNISPDLHTSIKSTLSNMWYNPKDIDRVLSDLPEWISWAWEIIPYVIKHLS